MSGNPDDANVWADADVYVAPLGTSLPANAAAAWPAGWKLIGLLDGDAGHVETREEEKTDHNAWGVGVIKTTRRNHKRTVKWTALEDNETVRSILDPGSTLTADGGTIVVPRPVDMLIGFETLDGDRKKRRISASRAQTDVSGDVTVAEGQLEKYPFTTTIYPNGDGELYIEQKSGYESW